MRLRSIIAGLGLLMLCGPVFASAKGEVSLKRVEKVGVMKEPLPGMNLKVRAPASTVLIRQPAHPSLPVTRPIPGLLSLSGKTLLFELAPGTYVDQSSGKQFSVVPLAAH